MMRGHAGTFLLIIAAAWSLEAQPPRPFYRANPSDSPRMADLKKRMDAGNRAEAVIVFWEDVRKAGAPLIEPVPGDPHYSWVTFLWQAKENTVNVAIIDGVAGGIGGFDPSKNLMTRLAGTDVWYRTYKVRNDAAFTYWISPNDSLESLNTTSPRSTKPQADPLNPRRVGPQSYVELPEASGVSLATASSPTRGKVERSRLHSQILNNERDIWVYTPPGFESSGQSYPLIVTMDGSQYVSDLPVPVILDNLIAQKRVPPMVAIMVGNAGRGPELSCNDRFADFLASEVVPWMRKNYNAGRDPARTIVTGSSLGGLAAMFAAFQHPEVFGNVLSQSGSYWWTPSEDPERSWLTRQFVQSPPRSLKISMSVGLMEVPDQLDTNRHLRDVLIAKGYALHYSEFNGNHGYVSWRDDFAGRLLDLAGISTR